MKKSHKKLTEKIYDLDQVFNELDILRIQALQILRQKKRLEKKIIKLFKKQPTVNRVETSVRIYSLRKKTEVDDREEAVARLMNHLQRKGKSVKSIQEWKDKMFSKKRPKTTLVVYKKI
jgi:UDP-glucose 6-dehydrogenase